MLKHPVVIGLLALTAAALPGCGKRAAEPSAFIVSIGITEPLSLLPGDTDDASGQQVLNALFTPLVEWDAQQQPRELAAESITSTDGRVWTIKLRAGWTFHNGEPVTADSYINAWNAGAWGPNAGDANHLYRKIAGYDAMNPHDAKQAPAAKKLTGLVKKDDLTFEVTLAQPYINFKSMLGHNAFLPLPTAAFADVANNVIVPAYGEAPIGQGPFRMQGTWQHDQVIRTERYAGYTGPRQPRIDGVDFRIYQQLATQYQDLLAGQLDIMPQLPVEQLASAARELGGRYGTSGSPMVQFLIFPVHDTRYGSAAIRRAISMAINREEIALKLYEGTRKPHDAFVPPVAGYRPGACGETCRFEPARAKALFDAAGGAQAVGGRIEFSYAVDGGQQPLTDAVCNQLRAVLTVPCVGIAHAKFSDLVMKAQQRQPVGIFRLGYSFNYPAIEDFIEALFASNAPFNLSGFSNAELDRLLAAGERAASPAAAIPFFQQAEDVLLRELPAIPLFHQLSPYAWSPRVAHVGFNVQGRVQLLELVPAP